MTTCSKCGKELEEGTKFCDDCGAEIFETVFCPNCGEQTSTEFAFCESCGASLTEEAEGTSGDAPKEKKGILDRVKALPKKALMFGGIGIAALVVIVLAVSLFSGGKGKGNFGLYLKDSEIVYTNYKKDGAREITSRLLRDTSFSDYELSYAASRLSNFLALSADGKRIFYPDRLESNADGVTLCCREVNKPKKEPVKIDSDVTRYAINDKGTQVVYLKGNEGILYVHNLKDKEKLARGVSYFHATKDLKKIGYLNDENSYYVWTGGSDAVKLASDIGNIHYVAEDLSVIYYTKDGSLYKQATGGKAPEKEKIAGDVARVIAVYESGEVYYTKSGDSEKRLLDYVNDDMAAADAAVTEPIYPSYPSYPDEPSWWEYDNDEEYYAARAQYDATRTQLRQEYDTAVEAYNTAYEAYRAKENRDYLREALKDETLYDAAYTLYYFDGKTETVVTDTLASSDVSRASDKAVLALQLYAQSDVPEVKLSQVDSVYTVRDMVDAALHSTTEKYVAVGAALTALEREKATSFRISADGSAVYFLDDVSENGDGDLYKLPIKSGKVGKAEKYDTDVSDNGDIFFLDGKDKLAYYKDVKNQQGELFINHEKVDDDVRLWSLGCDEDGSAVVYYTDWNSDKGYGTLKVFKGGKKTKIADDVHDFYLVQGDNVLYISDYSTNHYTGTLNLYSKGKSKKVDDDVAALLRVYPDTVKGGYYGW